MQNAVSIDADGTVHVLIVHKNATEMKSGRWCFQVPQPAQASSGRLLCLVTTSQHAFARNMMVLNHVQAHVYNAVDLTSSLQREMQHP